MIKQRIKQSVYVHVCMIFYGCTDVLCIYIYIIYTYTCMYTCLPVAVPEYVVVHMSAKSVCIYICANTQAPMHAYMTVYVYMVG